jgi:hypothetical protein
MYPYDFEPFNKGLNPEEIFVVMPFGRKYDDVFDILIKRGTAQVAAKRGITLEPFRTKQDRRTVSGWRQVLEHLYPAQILLGVLTKVINGNVFYELGIAHATQPLNRQVLIAEKNYKPLFDTKDLIFMRYNPTKVEDSVDELTSCIEAALDGWYYEQEILVKRAIAKLSPFDFEVTMDWGRNRNFAMKTSEGGPETYRAYIEAMHGGDPTYMDAVFHRHSEAVARLLQIGLLALNTLTKEGTVEFSYYWTDLGNLVLMKFGIINQNERRHRFETMPEMLRYPKIFPYPNLSPSA